MHASDVPTTITAIAGLVVAITGLVGLLLHRSSTNTRLGNLEAGAAAPPAQDPAPTLPDKLSGRY